MSDWPDASPEFEQPIANAAGGLDDDELPRGEWVRFYEFKHVDRGILAETDIGMKDVSSLDGLAPIGGKIAGFAISGEDVPHDLIWTGRKDYVILPRTEWSPVHRDTSSTNSPEVDDA